MEDISLQLLTGVDIPLPDCKLVVHQPTIKEISAIGETNYYTGIQILCMNAKDRIDLADVTNFQIFMTIMSDKESVDKKKIVLDTLFLLFPNYKVVLTPRALLLNFKEENGIIDENNFSSLQEVLRKIACIGQGRQEDFNPANAQAAEIARKLERGRQRVAAQKQGAEANGSVFSQYLSVLSVGLHLNLLDLLNLTVFQTYDLLERYTLFVNWDLDIRSRLAGGKPDTQPDNWMKIIH